MADKEYNCIECVNKATPLCNMCRVIKSPSGRESKPTYYVALTTIQLGENVEHVTTQDEKTEGMAWIIAQHLNIRVPIPTSIVLNYNRQVEQKEE